MRILSKNELPENYKDLKIIKSHDRDRCVKMNTLLERTLSRCNDMYAEYQLETNLLRENCQREGFSSGFDMFFSQLLQFIEQYSDLQNARLETLKESLTQSIKSSFNDTMIVERILHHLHEKCGQIKPLKIILPSNIRLSGHIDHSNFIFSNEENITLQTERDSIRFPISLICQQWMDKAESNIAIQDEYLEELVPQLLNNINKKIQHLIESY